MIRIQDHRRRIYPDLDVSRIRIDKHTETSKSHQSKKKKKTHRNLGVWAHFKSLMYGPGLLIQVSGFTLGSVETWAERLRRDVLCFDESRLWRAWSALFYPYLYLLVTIKFVTLTGAFALNWDRLRDILKLIRKLINF